MARAPKFSNGNASRKANGTVTALSNGYLRLYDGIKPVDADTAITTQVLLAELRFASPAAPAAVAGVATFAALTADASANASGTATWFRAFQSDGTTVEFDGTVGTSGADLNLVTAAIVATTAVAITGVLKLTESKG